MVSREGATGAKGEAKIVEIIPIIRGLPKETLTYFTTESPELGSFVRIPIRSGEALGIVSSIKDVRSARSEIRGAEFSLRKLTTPKKGGGLSPAFMRAAVRTAHFYAATTGSVLGALVSSFFLAEPELLRTTGNILKDVVPLKHEPLLMQAETDERYSRYFGLVRESFARSKSVLFIVPSKEDGERAFKELSRGIESYTFFFRSSEKPKAQKELLLAAKNTTHSILFITTPSGLAFERSDFGLVILERENSRGYRTLARPFVDLRFFVRALADEAGNTLVLGDSVLSVEALESEPRHDHPDLLPLKWRLPTSARTTLVDMKIEPGFRIFSNELESLVRRARDEHSRIFLFGARKGFAPTTVCQDCGSVLSCKNCGAPVILVERGEERRFVCRACGFKRSAETLCDSCGSWKLEALGIGTERIAAEAEQLFPDLPIFTLDKDHAPTAAKQKSILKKFNAEQSAILVGTELAFSHLDRIPYVALVSADALFSVPDFRIHERIFNLVTRLRELATREALIQTRNIGKPILEWAAKGNVLDFYKAEIKDREAFQYPPFSVFITVTATGAPGALERMAAELNKTFAFRHPEFVKLRGKKGKTDLRMILRVPREEWPDDRVVRELLLLRPEFSVTVDPDSLL